MRDSNAAPRMRHFKPRILFLSHAASRNGATILLLDFLRWLAASDDLQIEVLMNGRGVLVPDFKKIAPVRLWRNPEFLTRAFPPEWRRVLKPWLEAQSLRSSIGLSRFDLVYANTAATALHLPFLATRSRSILWHIHELAFGVRLILGPDGPSQFFPMAARFIAASTSSGASLVNDFQVPAAKVDVVHSFITFQDMPQPERLARRLKVRRQLGWSADTFVVGACGSLGWRKGSDIFLQVARHIRDSQNCENIRFLWVGGKPFDEEVLEFEHDLRTMDLQERCLRVSSNANVFDYYCAMDVFAMTSRDEALGLVMLEATTVGLPVICFANSGGPAEFVGQDAGCVAPYLDVATFSRHIKALRDNPALRTRLSAVASRRVRSNYSTATQAPKLLECIQRCLTTPAT